jgi:hypothetical protein
MVGLLFVKGAVGFAMPLIMISGLSLFIDPLIAIAGIILPITMSNFLQAIRFGWSEMRAATCGNTGATSSSSASPS